MVLLLPYASLLRFFLGLTPQAVSDCFVPFHHVFIWRLRKGICGKKLRKHLARLWVDDVELAHGILYVLYMLLRVEKKLNRLPSDVSFGFERRYRGCHVPIISWSRLQ
jgi:hypothetical protein